MVATQHEVKENKLIPLTLLFPHSQNYRQHPTEQIRKLKTSLERFGQVRSIVTQEHANGSFTIVAGHGVFQAAEELGYQELRADILPQDWTPAQVNGYLVADNALSSDAVDDASMLVELLSEQQNAGYDLASVGSDEETLRQMLVSLGGSDEDEQVSFKEYDESIADDLDTELCAQCGKLCIKSEKGKAKK